MQFTYAIITRRDPASVNTYASGRSGDPLEPEFAAVGGPTALTRLSETVMSGVRTQDASNLTPSRGWQQVSSLLQRDDKPSASADAPGNVQRSVPHHSISLSLFISSAISIQVSVTYLFRSARSSV